jgi:succinylglutamate desuccinylase
MTYVIECLHEKQVTIKAAKQVQNQIKRYLSQNTNRLARWQQKSKKSEKAYQEYCSKKEST